MSIHPSTPQSNQNTCSGTVTDAQALGCTKIKRLSNRALFVSLLSSENISLGAQTSLISTPTPGEMTIEKFLGQSCHSANQMGWCLRNLFKCVLNENVCSEILDLTE